MKYEITRGQLVALWVFGIIIWLWASTDLLNYNPSIFSLPLFFLIPASLVFYTIGWKHSHGSSPIFLTDRVKRMFWNDDGRRVQGQQPPSDSPKGNESVDMEASVLAQNKITPNEKQKTEKLIRTKGGVVVILAWTVLVVVVLRAVISLDQVLYSSLDNLANMTMLSGIFFAGCYSAIVRKYKVVSIWYKFILVIATIILMSIASIFLDKWTGAPSEGALILEEYGREISSKNYPEKFQVISQRNETISDILSSMEDSPSSKVEAEGFVLKIDQVISLFEVNSNEIQDAHRSILAVLGDAETEEGRAEVIRVFKLEFGQNLDALPEYSSQYLVYADAYVKNLEAQKKYYLAYANDEEEDIQNYYLALWVEAENAYLAEWEKLSALHKLLVG